MQISEIKIYDQEGADPYDIFVSFEEEEGEFILAIKQGEPDENENFARIAIPLEAWETVKAAADKLIEDAKNYIE